MTYLELCAAVADTTENTFAADDLARFARLTEQRAYNEVQPPALRKNVTSSLTVSNPYLTLPSDFLYVYSLAVDGNGGFTYLLNKDVSYVREVYPSVAATGSPKVYAQFDRNTLLLGPTPDAAYAVELNYAGYPESIVTASTSWLGDTMDSVLFNGMLVEAARFMKSDKDIVELYDKAFMESLALLKQLGDGKLKQDTYRSGQARVVVR